MKKLFNEVKRLLGEKEGFVLASIIEHSGSTPRSRGARMIIRSDKTISGTIGGGLLEAKVRIIGESILVSHKSIIEQVIFTGEDAAQTDMICGGEVKVFLEWVDTENSENCIALREMQRELDMQGCAYIFGAGHVSQALAQLTVMLGFTTIVLDDRDEYANPKRFPSADQILTPNPIQSAFETLIISKYSFIIIVTRGHLQDREVLEKALQTSAGYIGMIGSSRKCSFIFKALQENGWKESDIARVNAPIGLNIRAETPEEIAVSIIAQMVEKRALMRS